MKTLPVTRNCEACLAELDRLERACPMSEQCVLRQMLNICAQYAEGLRHGENHPELQDEAMRELHLLVQRAHASWFHEPANRAEANRLVLLISSHTVLVSS